MSKKVSACIVTYNNINYIGKTVGTLLRFTQGVDFTLYVVDNGSTDGTLEFLEQEYTSEERLKIIKTGENTGFGVGHNKILNIIDSDYHIVVNPDIIIADDVVEKMANYMEEHKDIDLLSPQICFPDGRRQMLGKLNPKFKYLFASRLRNEEKPSRLLQEYTMMNQDWSKPFDIENASGCFMFFRTSAFKRLGGFDERYFMYFEDCDITREINKTSRTMLFPDAIVYHVWGRDSKRNFKLMFIHIKSMFSYFWKWRR
ncbi:MAG: glycosyltransferase family 2 protein [Oscillospiraceae bacterium]